MGLIIPTTECEIMYRDFFQKLASTLMKDGDGNIIGFNVMVSATPEGCACEPVIDCDLNHIEPIRLAAMHGFGVDACGRLAIKLVACDDAEHL